LGFFICTGYDVTIHEMETLFTMQPSSSNSTYRNYIANLQPDIPPPRQVVLFHKNDSTVHHEI